MIRTIVGRDRLFREALSSQEAKVMQQCRRWEEELFENLLNQRLIDAVVTFAFAALKLQQLLGNVQMATQEMIVDRQENVFQVDDLVVQLLVDVRRRDVMQVRVGEQTAQEKEEIRRLQRVVLKILGGFVQELKLLSEKELNQLFALPLRTA